MTSENSVPTVAADSNALLSAAAGRAARRVFAAAPEIVVVTTEENLREVREYLPMMAERYGIDLRDIENALTLLPVEVIPEESYGEFLEEAFGYLGKRDPDDVSLSLACDGRCTTTVLPGRRLVWEWRSRCPGVEYNPHSPSDAFDPFRASRR